MTSTAASDVTCVILSTRSPTAMVNLRGSRCQGGSDSPPASDSLPHSKVYLACTADIAELAAADAAATYSAAGPSAPPPPTAADLERVLEVRACRHGQYSVSFLERYLERVLEWRRARAGGAITSRLSSRVRLRHAPVACGVQLPGAQRSSVASSTFGALCHVAGAAAHFGHVVWCSVRRNC